MDIAEIIKSNKKNISDSSLKAYTTSLNKLHKLLNNKGDIKNLDFLDNFDNVMKVLNENYKDTTKKNYLVAIINLIKNVKGKELNEKYNAEMTKLNDIVQKNYDKNNKTENQKKNWIEYEEVLKLVKKYKKDTERLFTKPIEDLTNKQKDLIQQYLVLYLYSGIPFPPLRNDFSNMKIVNKDFKREEDKNYFVVQSRDFPFFELNEYKTSKKGGKKIIPVKDKELRRIIHKWVKISKKDILLINPQSGTAMTENGITKYLQKIFMNNLDKSISSSLLRSIYISHKYDNKKMTIEDKKELAEDMLHSKNMSETVYNKI